MQWTWMVEESFNEMDISEYEPCKSCIGISGLVGPVPRWPDSSLQSVDSVEDGM